MSLISITLNGEPRELPELLTIEKLIEHFSLPKQRVAIEHNSEVVRRVDWPERIVGDRDTIEIVHFVGGG